MAAERAGTEPEGRRGQERKWAGATVEGLVGDRPPPGPLRRVNTCRVDTPIGEADPRREEPLTPSFQLER